jgi:hypothetical protein
VDDEKFWRNMLLPYSGFTLQKEATCSLKRWYLSTNLHAVTCQKTVIFTVPTITIPDLKYMAVPSKRNIAVYQNRLVPVISLENINP